MQILKMSHRDFMVVLKNRLPKERWQDIADKSNLSRTGVINIVKGTTSPRLETFASVLNGVGAKMLLKFPDQPEFEDFSDTLFDVSDFFNAN